MRMEQDGVDGGGVDKRQQHLILPNLGHRITHQHVLSKSDLLLQAPHFHLIWLANDVHTTWPMLRVEKCCVAEPFAL